MRFTRFYKKIPSGTPPLFFQRNYFIFIFSCLIKNWVNSRHSKAILEQNTIYLKYYYIYVVLIFPIIHHISYIMWCIIGKINIYHCLLICSPIYTLPYHVHLIHSTYLHGRLFPLILLRVYILHLSIEISDFVLLRVICGDPRKYF